MRHVVEVVRRTLRTERLGYRSCRRDGWSRRRATCFFLRELAKGLRPRHVAAYAAGLRCGPGPTGRRP